MQISFLLIFSLCSGVAFSTYLSSTYPKECKSPDDCGPDECCVLGMDKYAIPQCKIYGQADEWCHVGAVPEDRILYFPGGTIKEVKNVYPLFCPCKEGLSCVKSKCRA